MYISIVEVWRQRGGRFSISWKILWEGMGWAGYKVDIIYIFHILDLKKDLKYKWLDVKFLLTLGVGIWIFEVFIISCKCFTYVNSFISHNPWSR